MGGGDEKDTESAGEIALPLSSVCGNSGCSPEGVINDGNEVFTMVAGEAGNVEVGGRKEKRECWAVDVERGEGNRASDSEEELVCRICHLDPSPICSGVEGLKMILLGCGCKGDMGFAHRLCALAWFMAKNNWGCEICGLFANNVYKEYCRMLTEARHARRSSSSDSDELFHSHLSHFPAESSHGEVFAYLLSFILLLALLLHFMEMFS